MIRRIKVCYITRPDSKYKRLYFILVACGEYTDFSATLKALSDYFNPKANVSFKRLLISCSEGGKTSKSEIS